MSYWLVLIDGFFRLILIIFFTEVVIIEVGGAFGVRLGFAELEPVKRKAAAEKHEQQQDQRCIAFSCALSAFVSAAASGLESVTGSGSF